MGRKQKGVYMRQPFETLRPGASNTSDEPYTALYVTMLTSGAYRNLSAGARNLYTYMKLQYLSKQNRKAGLQPDQFYFNRSMQVKFGFTNKTQFVKWRDELVQFGFIDIVECGKTTRTKSIYALSDRWHKVEYKEKKQNAGTRKLKEKYADNLCNDKLAVSKLIQGNSQTGIKSDTRKGNLEAVTHE